MRVHVIALADIPVQRETPCCAFTTKAYHLCKMLGMRGHHVTLYGCEGSDQSVANELVVCVGKAIVDTAHPNGHWEKYQIKLDNREPCYDEFCRRVRYEIPRHAEYGHAEPVCLVGTWCHAATKNLGENHPVVESGIGNPFSSGTKYRVFESQTWRSWFSGMETKGGWRSESPWDVVIPNAFDPDMFTPATRREDYGLFMGRINDDKGWRLAMASCSAVGLPLKIVGQLHPGTDEAKFLSEIKTHGATWLPPAGIEQRRELMGQAKVFFCPTQYHEPFGGVAVEAMMSGCPVISSDHAAFTETVQHGMTGFRCHGVREMVQALGLIAHIDPCVCRTYAIANYSLARVSEMYEDYLENVVADAEHREPGRTLLRLPLRIPAGVELREKPRTQEAPKVGFFYQVYKDLKATESVLRGVRAQYPTSPIVLISDGGDDFADLATRYDCRYQYGKRIVSARTPERWSDGPVEAGAWLLRLADAMHATSEAGVEWTMLLQDDVLVRGQIPEIQGDFIAYKGTPWEQAGNPDVGRLRQFIRSKRPDFAIPYYNGCGGTMFRNAACQSVLRDFAQSLTLDALFAAFPNAMCCGDLAVTTALALAGIYATATEYVGGVESMQNQKLVVIHGYRGPDH